MAGISSYSYSTEQKYGEEDGSLKLDFAVTSTNWISFYTTATTLISEEFIEFYVYNDSEQYKAMCVGWHVPSNANDTNYMIIEPNVWTKITCKSSDLTDAGGASGAIQVCGLSDLTNRRANAPIGTLYVSSVIKKGAAQDIINARVGEDSNTLLFFDRELGLQQATESGGIKEFDENVVFNGERGALKMTYTGNASPTIGLMLAKYPFKTGDYVVLNVYADLQNADYMQVRVGTLFGSYCYNQKWTTVIFPATALDSIDYLRFDASTDGGNYKPNGSADMNGYVYVTKAKVYSANQVKNLTEVDSAFEYNIGSTTFVGKASYVGKNYGSYEYNPTIYSEWHDKGVALIDDQVRFYARSDSDDNATSAVRETVVGFELKDGVACADKKLYIVASGLVDDPEVDDLLLQVFSNRESGHFASPRPVSREVLEDGYVKYCFDLSIYPTNTIKYFRLWTGHKLIIPDKEMVVLRDVYFE